MSRRSFLAILSMFLAALALIGGGDARAGVDDNAFFRRTPFVRGDANDDGIVDISDAIRTLARLFSGGEDFPCERAADSNADGSIDITDAIFSLGFLFLGGELIPAPGPFSCGVAPGPETLSCESSRCPAGDLRLIAHVLDRITFGPTEELLTRIQTRDELLRYIEEQLAAPDDYDQAVHEPELHREVERLEIGFRPQGIASGSPVRRLKAMLFLDALKSRWQLLQVVTRFWNNHFHTQIDSLRNQFFSRDRRGGRTTPATATMFRAVDRDRSGGITRAEWVEFRNLHPGAIRWEQFSGSRRRDGLLSQEEFLQEGPVGAWKYRGGNEQLAVSADLERREYDFFRRKALGKFRVLLEGHARSPAQVIYLNGFENTLREPNENYARELLELFSLGVDRVYTQRDIEQIARVLTGWSVDWVQRSQFSPADILLAGNPGTRRFPMNRREPPPFEFPDTTFWDDGAYGWGFVFVRADHHWGRKDVFLRAHGGVDSHGNPVPASAAVRIPATSGNRTAAEAMDEFGQVLERIVSFRDCARFISTKLIQLLVTDDPSRLKKTRPLSGELLAAFDSVDRNGSGAIDTREWEAPVPGALPNGRPPEILAALDVNHDRRITRVEYQEPDLLLDAIDAWRRSDGEIREVLRVILHSEEFLSLQFYRAKVKDPFEFLVSAVRGLDGRWSLEGNIDTNQMGRTIDDLTATGMELFNFADPTGESELGLDWMHTVGLLERLRHVNLGANSQGPADRRFTWNPHGLRTRWNLETAERAVDFLGLLLLNGDVPESQRALAIEASDPFGSTRVQAAAGFLLSLPQFQKQ